MTTPVRKDILNILSELGDSCPDVRFGQLIANLSYLAKGPTHEAIWDVEDEELLAAARKHLQERKLVAHTGVEDIAKAS
jgi:hypothetical protein